LPAPAEGDAYRHFPPRVEKYIGPEQTIGEMRELALAAQTAWPLRRLVEDICRGITPKAYGSELVALLHFVYRTVRYQRDPRTVELVKTPEATLRTGVGDCDDQATLLAALAMLAGSEARFVALGFRADGVFSHVYCEALEPRSRRWIALDPVSAEKSEEMLRRARSYLITLVDK
jgi:transglutaminase-like putative cysteine protease